MTDGGHTNIVRVAKKQARAPCSRVEDGPVKSQGWLGNKLRNNRNYLGGSIRSQQVHDVFPQIFVR